MTRLDPLLCIVWGAIGIFAMLFWVLSVSMLAPPTEAALQAAWEAVEKAGTLNGCERLSLLPGECTAFAQGGNQ